MMAEGEGASPRLRSDSGAALTAPRSVALYLPDLSGGGAERMMVNLAAGMARRGVQVYLVLAKARGPYLAEVPDGVELIDLDAQGVVASVPALVRFLRRARPDAALGTLPYASLALLLAARIADPRLPVFIREASTPSAVRFEPHDRKTRAAMWLSKRFYRRADGVVAVSAGVAEDVHEFLGVPREKVTTIHNPVVTPDLARLAAAEPEHEWFSAGSAPVVLSVGRLGPEKNFDVLLRAFALLRDRLEARLLILGEGGERAKLEALARELGIEAQVSLPGFVSNPLPYMARASLYVVSSEREGLPGSLIQALAVGCPAVSTDCPNGPREVLEGGRYGPLVPVGDHHSLAEAMQATLESPPPAEQLRRRGNAFSEEKSIDGYLALFASALPVGRAVRRSEAHS